MDHPKSLKGNNDILNLTQPDIIYKISMVSMGNRIADKNVFH